MANALSPQFNQWYLDKDRRQQFQVVEITNDYIELEFKDGNIEQLSLTEWLQQNIQVVAETDDKEDYENDVEFDDDMFLASEVEQWDDDFDDIMRRRTEKDDEYF